jgi:hypothetical protein
MTVTANLASNAYERSHIFHVLQLQSKKVSFWNEDKKFKISCLENISFIILSISNYQIMNELSKLCEKVTSKVSSQTIKRDALNELVMKFSTSG